MFSFEGLSLKIGELTARMPIIQGGMGVGISLSGLASAVANTGGIGVISAAGIGMLEKDFANNFLEANLKALRNEIRKAKEKTKGILGVNIMVAMSNFAETVKTSIEEKIDIIFAGAGLPLNLPSFLGDEKHTKLVPIVSSARAIGLIARKWIKKYRYTPDAVVVEGPMAGGHLGFNQEQLTDPDYSLEKLVVEVIDEVKKIEDETGKQIPVIAGGGIYTGEDIYRITRLGAAGVQMATRFVTTEECDASIDFKKTYINCKKEDIGIIKSPVGMPGRAIVNDFLHDVDAGRKKPYKCPYHCIVTCDIEKSPYCIALALMNAKVGKLKHGFAFAGVNAYRANEIVTVEELMKTLAEEYNQAVTEN
ncbi:MAG: NAD(P)H-dependent flavin oxidoreductase [Acetivibrionales bacterium]|jgi:nitronate monooxygenase|nr:nitronate monooxygenase [Clostridiaceae bacterium]